ncbi:MAG: metal ABC transporter permease [Thermoproteales archaeon]|nr:metal ABC transporter permease [Thermoproteales archaeon]
MLTLFASAILASMITGSLCGVAGVFVAKLRLSTLTFAVAHAALCGAALGLFLETDPVITAVVLAVATSLVLGPLIDVTGIPSDTLAMVLFSVYNALTFIFIFFSPGPALAAEKVGGILWGSVLAVTKTYLIALFALLYVYLFSLLILWSRFQSILFDRRLAEAEGVNTKPYVYLLMLLTGIVISIALRIVGGFLVFSLLYIPAACGFTACNFKKITLVSALIGGLAGSLGVVTSFAFNFPVGTCIVITAALIFTVVVVCSNIKKKKLFREISKTT